MQDVQFFRSIYRDVPIFFPSLLVMISSSIFYAMCSWYVEKVFPGEYGMPADWNFLFKREERHDDQWREDLPLTTTRSIVRVEHLVKRFGPDQIAVNDVSFDLHENQITSLLGPNGSGKTTIFNCLIGMLKQTSGRILIDNQFDTRTNIEMLRRSMGYCPQHDILFDLLTIEEQLQFYAVARGFSANIADEMLRRVNLQSSKHLFCQSLSGGMKRRLSLACAFIGETKIVLLDEVTALDSQRRKDHLHRV